MKNMLLIANQFISNEDSPVEAKFESVQLIYRLSLYEQSRASTMKNTHMEK